MPEKKRSSEGSYEQKQERLRAHFDKENGDTYIIYTFPDAVILKDYKEGKYYEIGYTITDDKITSGDKNEVELSYIQKKLIDEDIKTTTKDKKEISEALKTYLYYKAEGMWPAEKAQEDKPKGAELSGPIFKKAEKQRIVYAAVLVPGEADLDADKGEKILTKEEVEQVAHKWMEEYGNIDYMHGLNNVAKPVETFLLPMEWEVEAYGKKMLLPEGTWVLAAKVINDKAWKEVEEGKLTGFSIMGIQNNVLKRIMDNVSKGERVDKELNASMKRVLIRDLGKNWIVPFVSLVDEPCVPKAKFFAIKQKAEEDKEKEDKGGVWENIMSFFKKEDLKQLAEKTIQLTEEVKKAGRSISDATYSKLKNALEALTKLIEKADQERKPDYMKNKKEKGDDLEMDEKDVQKLINETLDEKLKPINEGLKALLPEEDKSEKSKEEKEKEATEKETAEKKKEEEEAAEEEASKKKKEEEDKEKESLKTENLTLKETLDKLQKAKKAISKVEKGQEDGEEDKKYTQKDHLEELGRDTQGRALKKKD